MKNEPRHKKGGLIGGRYLVHDVKMGGMGEVYLCLDLEQMQPCALKTFQQRYLTDALRMRQAFEREVATWVALEKHPNIVRCFGLEILDHQPFMVLEWVAGKEGRGADLRSWLQRGTLDLKVALEVVIDVCRGLMHAQEKNPGLVHRDLKPENILMMHNGLAKITDFGLARIVEKAGLQFDGSISAATGRQSLVGSRGIVGTPAYMAPEQWRGAALDQRTDIYALGVILYELTTGRHPFWVDFTPTPSAAFEAWLQRMQTVHNQSHPSALPAPLPEGLGELLHTCLAKTPAKRPASLTDLLVRLNALYQQQFDQSPPARPDPGVFTAGDYNNRGNTYAALQQHAAALTDFNQALKLDANDANLYNNRGNTYAALQQPALALADFDRAIKLDPKYSTAYSNRGNTYQTLQQHTAALIDYDRAIELDPHNAIAYFNRGNMYLALQQYADALADYSRAVEIDPNYALAYSNRANTYQALQQHTAALADFSRAIKLNPNLAQIYSNRGTSHQALRRYPAALADYRRAIEIDPNYTTAYCNLGALLVSQGQLHEALVYLEKAAQLGDPKGAWAVAQVRHRLGASLAPQGSTL